MSVLLADIGGTNTRCAVTDANGCLEEIRMFENIDFEGPALLLERYLNSLHRDRRPTSGALAVAAPINDDIVQMLNIGWRFSTRNLQQSLGLERLEILNDFEALARALPEFEEDDLLQIGPGSALPDKPKAVLGPGTGLGVSGLIPTAGGWFAISGEGGHVTLAAADAQEAEIIARTRDKFGHCSAERLISGPGLSILHATLHQGPHLDAPEIAQLAADGAPAANETLEVFFRMLGTVAANLALTLGAFGGVYIGGGIVPRHAEKFASSGFRNRFSAKGRYDDYLAAIATFLIVADHPTLTGLAAHVRQNWN
jgi:glucokinase